MQSRLLKILPWSWALIWFMFVVSLNGSMIAIWVFTLLTLLHFIFERTRILKYQLRIIILPVLLFLWYLLSWILNDFSGKNYEEIISKSALILIPILILLAQNIKGIGLNNAMRGFIAGLVLSGLHLIIRAITLAISGYGMEDWTYHGFTSPYESGAIYYSWYLTIATLYLMFGMKDPRIWRFRDHLILLYLVLLLAAASKLFIIVMIPVSIWYFLQKAWRSKQRWLTLVVISLVLVGGSLPFMNRLQELDGINPDLICKEEYSYDTPLNGITLRMIQWRFGLEIMGDEKAWIIGVGPGNGQKLLDEKYDYHGLYTGNPELGDRGYLGYNFHNQYVETLVETGLPGLIILLLTLLLAVFGFKKMLIFPKTVFLVTILFFLTESVLERQAGILVFSMLIVMAPVLEHEKTN